MYHGGYKDLSRVYLKNDKVMFHGFCEIIQVLVIS